MERVNLLLNITRKPLIRKTQKIPLKEIAKAEEIKKVYLNSKK
ncbi:hypothetical protein M109_1118 [Bacteroides fragilis str. 3397 N2]|jgi:hypothetical protein|nr:hypothetical protein M080_1513 [Bacteroides fragilis str. 3397 T10]EXZ50501.1 hypothetical protein M109_1118 [Bacteroides fragilis str. 3397 N2]EXZ55304.1 hypothetical protein M108_0710 [Bacteroides fragilis str. 3397 T14]EYA45183.1 hypothetical protein M110_0778 [Bacteroides fragilis str. 3397 N3]